MLDQIKEMVEHGSGMISLGRHLGLYYAPRDNMIRCPRGWLFIAVEDHFSPEK